MIDSQGNSHSSDACDPGISHPGLDLSFCLASCCPVYTELCVCVGGGQAVSNPWGPCVAGDFVSAAVDFIAAIVDVGG